MPFDAIVHAPTLRPGARVNIAQADQTLDSPTERLAVGAEVKLRFGVCCPDKARGTIIDQSREADKVMLAIGTQVWPLQRSVGGVTTSGLVSEHWVVGKD